MTLIANEEHVFIPAATPTAVLRHLLEVNNLKQKDLEDIASQTLVSDILNGRRQISKRLAKALAARFNVDIAAFI
jgi:HTH-type transcriptional regulator/antitoxin HigA